SRKQTVAAISTFGSSGPPAHRKPAEINKMATRKVRGIIAFLHRGCPHSGAGCASAVRGIAPASLVFRRALLPASKSAPAKAGRAFLRKGPPRSSACFFSRPLRRFPGGAGPPAATSSPPGKREHADCPDQRAILAAVSGGRRPPRGSATWPDRACDRLRT